MPLTVDTETLRPEKAVQDLRASRPDCLSNTAEAVREVSKKIGNSTHTHTLSLVLILTRSCARKGQGQM